jgi:hypothetical protein
MHRSRCRHTCTIEPGSLFELETATASGGRNAAMHRHNAALPALSESAERRSVARPTCTSVSERSASSSKPLPVSPRTARCGSPQVPVPAAPTERSRKLCMLSIRTAAAAARSEGAHGSHLVQSTRRDGLSGAARHDEVRPRGRRLASRAEPTIAQVSRMIFWRLSG